ncbi:uncharacterized protein [Rutidosis leptorrhynchoides]|uniref:uncharacterized protein n=1 Tax=Rutidosis leptorrhynchoides TaxID=125765 RepID=UPI003A99005E
MDSKRKSMAANSSKHGVVVGSVWESRMRGSFKVFKGDDNDQETENLIDKIQEIEKPIDKNQDLEKVGLRIKQRSDGISGGGKRKTWKSDGNLEENGKSPDQISKVRSQNKKVLGEFSKYLSGSIDGNGIKKSPIQMKKGRQEWNKEQNVSIDGIKRSPVQMTLKTRALSRKESASLSIGIEQVKPLLTKLAPVSDETHEIDVTDTVNRDDDDDEKLDNISESSHNLDEIDECDEKLMTLDMAIVKSEDCEELGEAFNMNNEEINEERAIVIVKEKETEPISTIKKSKSLETVIEDKKVHHRNERSHPIPRTIRKHPIPVVNHPRIISRPSKNEFPSQRVPKSHSKLQTFADLIMWRDASKSALIFGLGTFSILSSSYTQDLNISFIAVISYMSLIYLGAIFIFKSLILRRVVDRDNCTDDEECVVVEEDAIWALKLFLPYINEFLIKVKALFSGDPATTMKLAVLLFILARSGSSITIWKMAKLAFFAVFTVPKICSSYSSQLTAYGSFWVQRFKDAWESCTQKKAVAFGVFTLVWNLSSTVARIWAVFMLLVAFKYYQQFMMKDEIVDEEEEEEEPQPVTQRNRSSWQEQRNGDTTTSTESSKLRKRC